MYHRNDKLLLFMHNWRFYMHTFQLEFIMYWHLVLASNTHIFLSNSHWFKDPVHAQHLLRPLFKKLKPCMNADMLINNVMITPDAQYTADGTALRKRGIHLSVNYFYLTFTIKVSNSLLRLGNFQQGYVILFFSSVNVFFFFYSRECPALNVKPNRILQFLYSTTMLNCT